MLMFIIYPIMSCILVHLPFIYPFRISTSLISILCKGGKSNQNNDNDQTKIQTSLHRDLLKSITSCLPNHFHIIRPCLVHIAYSFL